jgi:hypothetical protein
MERPTLQRGQSLEDFARRQEAWIATWTLDDALSLLVDRQDEGPSEEKACELICGAIERVRELHSPDDSNPDYGTVCSECLGPDEMQAPWPCATRAITDGVEQAPWPRWRGHAAG